MAQQVQGKAAIVTGAGSGINLEFTRLLLSRGCNVLLADLALRPEAQELVARYERTGNRAVFCKTDVTSWPALENMFSVAEQQFGSIDIVCPGAGVFEPHWTNFWYPPGTAESKDDPTSGRYHLLDINLVHPIRVTQLAISHFLSASPPASPSNPKTIVHISSVAAQIATIMFPMYCASKHGIEAFVRSLAPLESTHGIRVAAVAPGIVKTPIWLEHPEKLQVLNQEGAEQDGWVLPEEVAEVMLACVERDSVGSALGGGAGDTTPISGGVCLEVVADSVRAVPLYDNPGPYASGKRGVRAGRPETLQGEILARLIPGWGQV